MDYGQEVSFQRGEKEITVTLKKPFVAGCWHCGPPICALAAVLLLMLSGPAQATTWNLTSGNSSLLIDDASMRGNYSWILDGVEQYAQQDKDLANYPDGLPGQWFWYRIGDSGPEQPVNVMSLTAYSNLMADPDLPDALTLVYEQTGANPQLKVPLNFTLQGGSVGSRDADLSEQISIKNIGTTPLSLHFFEYADFDLGATADDDQVRVSGTSNPNMVDQYDLSGQWIMSETIIGGDAKRSEAKDFSLTLADLTDADADDLDYVGSALPPVNTGDVTWAMQWDLVIAPGGTVSWSKDKDFSPFVPEPVTMAGLLFGVGSLVGYVRKRRN